MPGNPVTGGDVTLGAGFEKGLDTGAVVGVKEKVEPPLPKEDALGAGALKLKVKAPALEGEDTGAEVGGFEGKAGVLPKTLDAFPPKIGAVVVVCAPKAFCSGGFTTVDPNTGAVVVDPNVNGFSTGFVGSAGASSFLGGKAAANPPNAGAGLGAGDPNVVFAAAAPNVNPVFFSAGGAAGPELN